MEHPLGITLSEAQNYYREYLQAELKITKNQKYKIDDKEFERADLADVIKAKQYWEDKCYELSGIHERKSVSIQTSGV